MEMTFTLANSAGTPLSSYAKNRPSGNCTRWAVTWGPLMLFSTFTGGGVMALYTNPTAAAINTKTNRRKSPVPSKKFHQNTLLTTHLQENPTHLLVVDLIHFGSKYSRGCQILCFSSAHLLKKLQAKLGTCVSFFSHKGKLQNHNQHTRLATFILVSPYSLYAQTNIAELIPARNSCS